MLSPKEKAKELYNKYEFVYIQNYTSSHEVKQCCLLACDEVIDVINKYSIHSDCPEDADAEYWENVKIEVERL
jgi:hypothetical protein